MPVYPEYYLNMQSIKKLLRYFTFFFFHTMSLEFTLSFVLMAHLGSDQLHFRCPIATCDSGLPYWTVQAYSFKLLFISCSVSTTVWIAKDKEECMVGDIVSSTQLYLKKGLSLSYLLIGKSASSGIFFFRIPVAFFLPSFFLHPYFWRCKCIS